MPPAKMYILCCCEKPCCPWPKSGGVLGNMIWLCGCQQEPKEPHEHVLLSKNGQSLARFPLSGPMLGPDCVVPLAVAGIIGIACAGFLAVVGPHMHIVRLCDSLRKDLHRPLCQAWTVKHEVVQRVWSDLCMFRLWQSSN